MSIRYKRVWNDVPGEFTVELRHSNNEDMVVYATPCLTMAWPRNNYRSSFDLAIDMWVKTGNTRPVTELIGYYAKEVSTGSNVKTDKLYRVIRSFNERFTYLDRGDGTEILISNPPSDCYHLGLPNKWTPVYSNRVGAYNVI